MPAATSKIVSTAFATGLALAGCLDAEPKSVQTLNSLQPRFEPVTLCIQSLDRTLRVEAELAETLAQRGQGLMERESLPANAGMLFTYPWAQPPEHGFWMYRTRIPLDVAFLDQQGTILRIQPMQPCPSADASACPVYASGVEYHAALETNQGFFETHRIREGDQVKRANGGVCPAP